MADSRLDQRLQRPIRRWVGKLMLFILQESYSYANGLQGELTLPIFYTPRLAEECLPEVRAVVQQIFEIKKATDSAKDDAEMAVVMNRLEAEVKKLEVLGCVLRDMSLGLVDFPAVRLGERVWLCWKLGEDHVSFWHTRHEGYAGRKRIKEQEFYDDDLAIRSLNREVVSKTQA